MYTISIRWQRLSKGYWFWTETSLMWSAVLQVKTKYYFIDFTVIYESKLDEIIDFSSETESLRLGKILMN